MIMKRFNFFIVLLLLLTAACVDQSALPKLTNGTPAATTTVGIGTQAASPAGSTSETLPPGTTPEATLDSQIAAITPEATLDPNATPDPNATQSPTQVPGPADVLKQLTSYRSKLSIEITPDGADKQTTSMNTEQTRQPFARHTTLKSVDGTNTSHIETILVANTQYTNYGDGWMVSQVTPEDIAQFESTGVVSYYDIAGSLDPSAYQLIDSQTVNGITSKHSRLTLTSDEAAVLAMGMTDLTGITSEVWIASMAGLPEFMVKFTLNASGKSNDIPAKLVLSQEMYDVNAAFTITVPQEATTGGVPTDVAMYQNPHELTTMEGFISYWADADVNTLLVFYEAQLIASGWTKGELTDLDPMKMETFTKGDKTLTLTLTPRESSGTDILITIE